MLYLINMIILQQKINDLRPDIYVYNYDLEKRVRCKIDMTVTLQNFNTNK